MITIFLADLYHDYHRKGSCTPTNAAYIGSYCKKVHGNNVEIKLFKEYDILLKEAKKNPPDILGLANYMWSEALNKASALKLKKLNPNLLVISGGPNIKTDKIGVELFLNKNKYVDHYILFGAEVPFSNIVTLYSQGGYSSAKNTTVKGCFRLIDGKVDGESYIHPDKNLDFIPSPFLSGMLDTFLQDGHIPIIETNRGCPFSCTFCVWGIAALGKIKTFSMERVIAEMQYVAKKFPHASSWILADANFGILPRDVEIAELLRKLYDKYKAFESVNIWWSKTVTPRSYQIAKILGKLTSAYVAFQSLDEEVLKNIKRSNISVEALHNFKKEVEHYTAGSYTDILLGLPGETKQSHMNSYYGALRLGFDQIGGGEVRLLPGSEMDEQSSRDKYKIKTKFRISEADVGVYDNQLIYELEEVVRQTSAISEKEMLELRLVRAFLYGATTLGIFKILNDILLHKNINILEVLDKMISGLQKNSPLGQLVIEFNEKSKNEWFETPESVKDFVKNIENRNNLINNPPTKLNYWLNGKILINPIIFNQLQIDLQNVLVKEYKLSKILVNDLLKLSAEKNFLLSLMSNKELNEKKVSVSKSTIMSLIRSSYSQFDTLNTSSDVTFKISERVSKEIKEIIKSSDLNNDLVLTTVLQRIRKNYEYDIQLNKVNLDNAKVA